MSGQSQSNNSNSSYNSDGDSDDDNTSYTVIKGWEHSHYAHRSDRYAYIGKDDDDREPMWVDWGPKSSRSGGGNNTSNKK